MYRYLFSLCLLLVSSRFAHANDSLVYVAPSVGMESDVAQQVAQTIREKYSIQTEILRSNCVDTSCQIRAASNTSAEVLLTFDITNMMGFYIADIRVYDISNNNAEIASAEAKGNSIESLRMSIQNEVMGLSKERFIGIQQREITNQHQTESNDTVVEAPQKRTQKPKKKSTFLNHITVALSYRYAYLPIKGSYYGYRLRSSDLSATLETYAEQTLQNDDVRALELSAGVEVFPQLEIVAFYGVVSSTYDVSLWWITIDNNQPSNLDTDVEQSISYMGARANFSFPNPSLFRPVLGASVSSWSMNSGYDYFGQPELQAEFPDLGAPSMLVLALEPGLQIGTGKLFQLWFRVPLTYSIIDGAPASEQSVEELQYQDRLSLEDYSPFGYGAMAGVRFKIPLRR